MDGLLLCGRSCYLTIGHPSCAVILFNLQSAKRCKLSFLPIDDVVQSLYVGTLVEMIYLCNRDISGLE